MNRREFLQFTLVNLAAALLPTNLIQQHFPKFNPDDDYGLAIPYIGKYKDLNEEHLAIKLLHLSAQKVLPPKCYYEIRFLIPQKYGMAKQIAWYTAPKIERRYNHNKLSDDGGYYFFGGYQA